MKSSKIKIKMNKHPNLRDWQKDNPGRSINDYFLEYPDKRSLNNSNFQTIPNIKRAKKNETDKDTGNIVFSILLMVSCILPWINIRLLSFIKIRESNAFELSKLIKQFFTDLPELIYTSIYLIPIMAFLSLIGESIGNWKIRVLGQVVALFVMIYWIVLIFRLIDLVKYNWGVTINPTNFFSYGLYLGCFASAYYLFDLVRTFMGER